MSTKSSDVISIIQTYIQYKNVYMYDVLVKTYKSILIYSTYVLYSYVKELMQEWNKFLI